MPFGHWTFLRILWERDGLTQRELSDEAGVMEPTTAAALKAMEERGYVSRNRQDGNRKNVYVRLTAKGRSLRARLVPLAKQVNELAVLGLRKSDVENTRIALLAVIENLRKDSF